MMKNRRHVNTCYCREMEVDKPATKKENNLSGNSIWNEWERQVKCWRQMEVFLWSHFLFFVFLHSTRCVSCLSVFHSPLWGILSSCIFFPAAPPSRLTYMNSITAWITHIRKMVLKTLQQLEGAFFPVLQRYIHHLLTTSRGNQAKHALHIHHQGQL